MRIQLCYAPPYGSARDPVNMIGMIAQNVMDGLVDLVTPRSLIEQASAGRTQDIVLLDVRNADEVRIALHPQCNLSLTNHNVRLRGVELWK
jgi:hypothetical protein